MRPDLQEEFLSKISDDSYQKFKDDLDNWLGMTIQYRVCEMPIFVGSEFRKTLEKAAQDIMMQCVTPEAIRRTESTLQDKYRVPNEDAHPIHSVVDFAVTKRDGGEFEPKLIELQGFPSLLGYQYALGDRYRRTYSLEGRPTMSELSDAAYMDLVKTAIYGDVDPEETVLMEIDPDSQKTLSDFRALKNYIGLNTVNIRDVKKRGRQLFATVDGTERQVKRIFNRAIIDELEDLDVEIPFEWNDDLDVEWSGHPNWYFRISKYSMPHLDHPAAPKTHFLDQLDTLPSDLDAFVLKPLYSFAGKGVTVGPSVGDVESIPESERSNWILQERVEYASCVATPHGMNKVEIRVMMLWLPQMDKPIPVMSMARTGRNVMMGARYNMDPWTGSSGCLFV